MFYARLSINGTNTDGQFTKSFLLKMFKFGAEVTVNVNGETLYLENSSDYVYFKNYKGI